MTFYRTDLHTQQVEEWASQDADKLSAKMQVQLYAMAVEAIEIRSRNTLSSVTVLAVVDRVIHESKEKIPILFPVTIDSNGMNLSGLLETCEACKKADLSKALRFLLTELLTILGDITADILTDPLHQELKKVTSDQISADSEIHSLQVKPTVNTNRDTK